METATSVSEQRVTSREIRLAARPNGLPRLADFALATVELPPLEPGEVRVRNTFMSVDPYMRGRMNEGRSYVPHFEIGEPLDGGAVGVVDASRDPSLAPGTTVLHGLGWREYAVALAKAFRPIDAQAAPESAYLGVLGMPGFTAWVGLTVIDRVIPGETVFVSSAAGAVGSIVGQIAKQRGARVVGSTRSRESATVLRERLGFDDVIVVEPGSVAAQLRAAAPNGIGLYFDNVGGEQLEAAIGALGDFGRIVACGMIAGYNDAVPGPRNMAMIVGKRLTIRGFIVSDHAAEQPRFLAEIGPLVASGAIDRLESIVDGLENAPAALLSLFESGAHLGKLLVRLSP